jgi:hypothetical protein
MPAMAYKHITMIFIDNPFCTIISKAKRADIFPFITEACVSANSNNLITVNIIAGRQEATLYIKFLLMNSELLIAPSLHMHAYVCVRTIRNYCAKSHRKGERSDTRKLRFYDKFISSTIQLKKREKRVFVFEREKMCLRPKTTALGSALEIKCLT